MTIDLQTAWRLAGVQNPTINIARNAILQAEIAHRQAVLAWLPNLNAGRTCTSTAVRLIASGGQIRTLTETSFYVGGGARTVAAESNSIPMIQFFVPFAEGLFNPLAARQQTAVMRYEASATNNNIMLDVTTAYLDLLAAETQIEALSVVAGQHATGGRHHSQPMPRLDKDAWATPIARRPRVFWCWSIWKAPSRRWPPIRPTWLDCCTSIRARV